MPRCRIIESVLQVQVVQVRVVNKRLRVPKNRNPFAENGGYLINFGTAAAKKLQVPNFSKKYGSMCSPEKAYTLGSDYFVSKVVVGTGAAYAIMDDT